MNSRIQTIENVQDVSFASLVEQHQAQLKSFLYRFTASREDAEDLAQDTFARAHQKIRTFKGQSSFKTWLFAIAANLAKDHLRAKKRWPADAQDKCKEWMGALPERRKQLRDIAMTSAAGRYEIQEHIDFCFTCVMKTLSLEQQLALMLAEIYSFRIKEIARILELSAGVVKHHLHNARDTMQHIFDKRCALINKEGICHQCSELNGFRNTKAETQRIVSEMDIVKASQEMDKRRLFDMRIKLVKAINPLEANGTELHDFLLQQTTLAVQADRIPAAPEEEDNADYCS